MTLQPKKSGIINSAANALVLRVIGAVAAFLFQLLMARVLGVEYSGVFYFALSVLVLLSTVGRLGLDKLIPKLLGGTVSFPPTNSSSSAIFLCLVLSLVISGGLAMLASWGLVFTSTFIDSTYVGPIKVGLPFVVTISLYWVLAGILVGRKQAALATIVQTLVLPICGLVVLLFSSGSMTAENAVFVYGACSFVATLLGFVFIYKDVPYIFTNGLHDYSQLSQITSSGYKLMLSGLSTQLALYIPVLVLGFLGTSAEVGLFAVSQRIALTISLVLFASNVVLAPRIAAMWKNRNLKGIEELASASAAIMFWVTLPVFLGLTFYPEIILRMFGGGFVQGSSILVVLTFAQIVNVLTSSVEQVLIMTGKSSLTMRSSFYTMLLCLFFCALLVPFLGGLGGAIAFLLSMVFKNVYRVLKFKEVADINVLPKLSYLCSPIFATHTIKSY